jgi:hypothetical protein
MLFTADNQKHFLTTVYVHGLDTRKKHFLYTPAVSLSCVQRAISYSGVKIFNSSNAELNPICYLLPLLGAHHILHVSRIRLIAFQTIYIAIEMTGKDSKTS